MIERRFTKTSTHENLPVHVVQAVFAQVLTGDMTVPSGDPLLEINSSITETLNTGEQIDLQAILNWIGAGSTATDKIVRWHRIESTLLLARHGGPKYATEALLKSKIENIIGGSLF